MKSKAAARVVVAVALMAVTVLALFFIMTGNFNIFTQIACFPLGFLFFVELSLICSLV